MKNKISINTIILIIIIASVASIIIGYFIVNITNKGESNFESNYYDIKLTNATIDFDTKTSIKINDDTQSVALDIPDLYKYKNTNSFNIDLVNIGTLDTKLLKYQISKIKTNIDKELVDIELSIKKGDKLLGGERKKLQISITYNGDSDSEEMYYSCEIGFTFKEIIK